MLHRAVLILHSAPILYRNIVPVVWFIKVFYGCMRVYPEDVKQKKRHAKIKYTNIDASY